MDLTIKRFNNDTKDILIKRIAAALKVQPRYIEKSKLNEILNQNRVSSFSNIKIIYNEPMQDLSSFLNIVKEKYPDVTKENAIKVFLSKRKIMDIYDQMVLQSTIQELNIENFYKNEKDKFDRSEREEVEKIIENDKKYTQNLETIESLTPIKHLDFKEESFEYFIETDIPSTVSIETIFSMLVCSEAVPFISLSVEKFKKYGFSSVYKVFKNFFDDIPNYWKAVSDTQIIFQLNNKSPESYTQCIGYFENGFFCFSLEIKNSNLTQELEDVLFSSLSSFSPRVNIKDKKIKSLTGFIYYPNFQFDTYIMSDLIMNNPFLSQYIVVDESERSSKTKSGLYLHFFLDSQEQGTCSITTKEGLDKEIIKYIGDQKARKVLSDNVYIRMRLRKIKNITLIENFVNLFSRFLSLYKIEKDQIIKNYKEIYPEFRENIIPVRNDNKSAQSLKDIVPDLFTSNYSRVCTKPPQIIDQGDFKEEIMQFPKNSNEGEIHSYICPYDDYKFIGLRDNILSSKEKYSYLPCCFKTDQNVKGKTYYNYLNDIENTVTIQQQIHKSSMSAEFDKFGELPIEIEKVLYSIDMNNIYHRKGVHKQANINNTFLECILEATDDKFAVLKSAEKIKRLGMERDNLNNQLLTISAQENPNKTIQQMEEMIKTQTYFNPRNWIRLCEEKFNCKIFVFTKDSTKNSKPKFLIPDFKGQYVSYNNKNKQWKTVLIYEHLGLTSEKNVFPRCELIVYTPKNTNKAEYSFPMQAYNKIEKLYNVFFKQYMIISENKELVRIKNIEPLSISFDSQYIDSYGKTRILIKDNVCILTDPLPPLNIKESRTNLKIEITSEEAIKFTIKNNFKVIKKDDKSIVISLNKDIRGTIKIKSSDENFNINDYTMLKTQATVLVEYFIFFYSKYYNTDSLRNIKNYLKNYIKINPSVRYKTPESNTTDISFMQKNLFVDKDNKLVIENNFILKKLIFNLLVRLKNNLEEVINYHTKSEILNFYDNPSTLVQQGTGNIIIQDFTQVQKIDTKIYKNQDNPSENPYFLSKNKRIYLVNEGKQREIGSI
jgi:predicted DNA-binding protein (MmcQ/YjbR family)